jgi:F-type H+-transporting ATPase subunit epsilon
LPTANLPTANFLKMFLEIITPDKKLFSGEVKSVKLPGAGGSFGILNDHAPIIASLKKGVVKVVDDKNATENFNINGGVVEVLKNKVILLAE